jgi:uncharacterized protein with NRDE domain
MGEIMKIYAIMVGFYSGMDNAEYDSFWSTVEKANARLMIYIKEKNLEQQRSRKTKELIGVYSDSDYYCYVTEIPLDEVYL